MKKKNRYLQAEEVNFGELLDGEAPIAFVFVAIAFALASYWLTLKGIEGTKAPETLPLFAAILAPVLLTGFISAWSKLKTVRDIEEEVEEAIESAAQAQSIALQSIEKANACDRLTLQVQSLEEERQSLSSQLASVQTAFANALQDTATAQEALRQALADKERALKNASTLHEEALQKAQNEGKSEALKWRKAYEALKAEVDEANAQKEVQTLTATVRNRMTAMTGRVWSEDIKAKHSEQLERLRALGVDVTLWEV